MPVTSHARRCHQCHNRLRMAQRAAGASRLYVGRNGDELSVPLEPRFTFDSFVVGKPNEFAYACARRV